ncbi:MFS-type transporter SLC18B1-like isoform X2 [Gigantopelta aegis]|uniref:MFS-type transporter SLC18B1-like isoform X2 n=1 Tax=Gigantopelta aegis TaxID=1735272 RepID=UPI001B88A9BB|nr:MFS-type transporter SLC18B1-like isoform X2 [Gigantopelta aegis]
MGKNDVGKDDSPILNETELREDRSSRVPDRRLEAGKAARRGLKITELPRMKLLLLGILCVGNLLVETWIAVMGPFFPQVAAKKDVSYTVIGVIFACFQFTIFVSSPVFGSVVSKVGAKFMLVSGLLVSGSCSVLFGFLEGCQSTNTFIALSLVTRSVEALGSAAFLTSSRAIASDTFPDNVAMIYGVMNVFTGIGLMAGFPLGGVLYEFQIDL